MSEETENMELLTEFSDLIRLQDLDEKFKEAHEVFKKLENDPDISSETLFHTYFLAGYQRGVVNVHRLVDGEMEFLDRMISRGETKKKEA